MSDKFCINCKNHRRWSMGSHGCVRLSDVVNPVTGHREVNGDYCSEQRSPKPGRCGPEGRFYEQLPEKSTSSLPLLLFAALLGLAIFAGFCVANG